MAEATGKRPLPASPSEVSSVSRKSARVPSQVVLEDDSIEEVIEDTESSLTQASGEEQQPEEGWTVVSNRRRQPRPKFRFLTGQDLAEAYQLITSLELNNPELKLEVRPNLKGEYIFSPKDNASETRLRELAQQDQRLTLLDPSERRQKVVLERYPLTFPLEAVEAHQAVISAKRLTGRDSAPTRQVLIVIVGTLPDKLDLGMWGRYAIRPYKGEPVRCFKCQRFNHLQATCKHAVRCGVCSSNHPTEECIAKLKANEPTTPKCPNCQKRYHAWNPQCIERHRRLQQPTTRHRQEQQQQQHQQRKRQVGSIQAPRGQGESFVPAPLPTRPAWGVPPSHGQVRSQAAPARQGESATITPANPTDAPPTPTHRPRRRKREREATHAASLNDLPDRPPYRLPTQPRSRGGERRPPHTLSTNEAQPPTLAAMEPPPGTFFQRQPQQRRRGKRPTAALHHAGCGLPTPAPTSEVSQTPRDAAGAITRRGRRTPGPPHGHGVISPW